MARAKNTDRSSARRRARAARAAALSATTEADDEEAPLESEAAPQPRRSLFSFPDVVGDIKALPGMFRTRRLLWIPVILLVSAFVLIVLQGRQLLPEALTPVADIALPLILEPRALFPFFIGGFLAPRASYLVGFLLGMLDATLIAIWLLVFPPIIAPTDPTSGVVTVTADGLVPLFLLAAVMGTAAAAFAAWYRNFLRRSQEHARENRMAREAKMRAERKEADRQARRPASSRRTTP